ncbi:hypothetical protein Vadar_020688 [Vaccinium darrowii]|uniref:Uncharacterized protein n=1 Tax=Vaccinium darrowii TaxID=229202 RepID=A0ACB7ZF75_9ERIC|nr:hypothetical protein Vadar_020688 [Vaccinium darrowii]
MDGFVSARPSRLFQLHTTHSPSFLGLHQELGVWLGSTYGKGVIIGVLDDGITLKHPSFNDEGMPPPPPKWKGQCEFKGAMCNNKIIGARNFFDSNLPPFNYDGHGTDTSSTAAGNFVRSANCFGQANGTASGMAPLAHLAIYKVCGELCAESSILAAIHAAVEEGVDILSLSLGGVSLPFHSDSISMGAFRDTKGHFCKLLSRDIRSTAILGNKEKYDGQSVFQPSDFPSTLLPLIYAGVNNPVYAFCDEGSLDNIAVKRKVVLCERDKYVERVVTGKTVKDAGGAAMILMNQKIDGYSTLADAHVLPVTHVSYAAGVKIKEYINSTSNPMATLAFKGTKMGIKTAPMVTSFSSRDPNKQSPGILKSDIVGPGLSILAAWNVSVENKTGTTSTFNVISGTSMSCPHLSGIVALLKSAHPDWSPAAIKSAIMTTADLQNHNQNLIVDERMLPANIFATGSGHVNPSKANDPGLIYDIKPEAYVPYLCGMNYTDQEVRLITATKVKCAEVGSTPEAELNYTSFSITLGSTNQTYTRTVTNVGPSNSSYRSFILQPAGVTVTLDPDTLEFSEVNQKLTYKVTFSRSVSPPENQCRRIIGVDTC